ncbi:putative ABC transport system permease protein [Breoghania corrubedonensis]|uniref:Putative ABC transport system permease protein n=1 Tax=Breoghania corrubedonensis TaxID=665038 RepID=A0A2T5V5R2_9HYPH|nr:ABC transporter permease [Breoghania corrubedonensis]PTW59088.1 putative ABC transport system permease protein [Breoghania corrubedonensis]
MAGFVAAKSPGRATIATAFRFALREMRGGLQGFYVFIACIALGVAAIAGVASLSRGLTEGITGEGRAILGGDLDFSLVHREVSGAEREFLDGLGKVSVIANMRAMARTPSGDKQALVEVKAIDGAYPLFGSLRLSGGGDVHTELLRHDDAWGAVVDPALLARLDISVGDEITLGYVRLKVVDTIAGEPDKLSGGIDFGPRLMISRAALEASKLLQPGTLVRWHQRVALDGASAGPTGDVAVKAVREEAETRFPDAGWRIRSRDNAAPGLSRSIGQFTQFLTLVGLTALVVGGVGVANAVRAFLDSKRPVIATFKCVGAPGSFVFWLYLIQILMLAGCGIAIGLVLGALLPFAAGAALSQVLPVQVIAGIYPGELALGLLYGVLTALAFALWPLGRAHDVPPTALFRDEIGTRARLPRRRYVAAAAVTVLVLAGLAVVLAYEPRIALIYVCAAAASFVLLFAVGRGVMALARRMPRFNGRSGRASALATEWRLALGNIHRPGALTPSVTLSLGLGLTLLVALTLIDGNLRRELTTRIAGEAPSFFFLDIQSGQMPAFRKLIAREAPNADLVTAPMLRGRLVKLNGVPTSQITPAPDAAWVLRGDRGITYSADLPKNSQLVAGKWWPKDYAGEPLVSFEGKLAKGLGLKIGDPVTVNVLGREITARVANTRDVEWESLALNFVMVFSPNTFAGAPHSYLATVTWKTPVTAEREIALLKAVSNALPTVTGVRVKDAIQQVNDLVGQLAWAIRGASAITLIASVLVLAGALAAGHRNRIHDAVILKTLGATRARLIAAYVMEYAMLGLATAIFAVFAGTVAAWYVIVKIMQVGFAFQPMTALVAALVALALSVGFGLIGTWRVLGERPAPVLRNL